MRQIELIQKVRNDQSPEGYWNYTFETGVSTDCYMIILLRSLEIDDENLIKGLSERILRKQQENGAWKLFHDEPNGNLSDTIGAYYALLYSGYYSKNNPRLQLAKQFIKTNGGIEESHMLTKIMLALTGQYKWPNFFPIPLEMILLPPSSPINFYSFSVYSRVNLAPIMILADKKFSLKTSKSPDLKDLFNPREVQGFPTHTHQLATEYAKQYMLNRIEPDGTLLSYFSSTFLMIFALLSLGYSKSDPIIVKAVKALKSMISAEVNGLPHMQFTTANVWNTSLLAYALQEAGVSSDDIVVNKANNYLLKKQHYKYGDWVIHNPSAIPGGWGFSESNTIHPDVDDTTASLRSIARNVRKDWRYRQAWDRGIQWVLSMQNDDGGWPAFEKNTNSKIVHQLPIEKAEYFLIDPSCADLTGRTLEFLGSFTNLSKTHLSIRRGVDWLMKNQEKDGSWYGRWGICYIYGTWGAVTGLRAVGVLPTDPMISKAVKWLEGIQNSDGGWGESCRSDLDKKYILLGSSTLTQTAWAVDALIAASDKPTKSIKRGVEYLLENIHKVDWTTSYPKGAGMAGDFYIHYHSYRYIFPILTLAHYCKKGW